MSNQLPVHVQSLFYVEVCTNAKHYRHCERTNRKICIHSTVRWAQSGPYPNDRIGKRMDGV